MLQLHNTLIGKKEIFQPLVKDKVTIYVCGPTVYNHPHIGNARPAVVFDLLYRFLQILYPTVIYARNITDIDDKIIERAHTEGVSHQEISLRYTQVYHENLKALNCLPPNYEPKVTHHLNDIYDLIEKLLQNKHAYEIAGNILFDIKSFDGYGKLSNRTDNSDFLIDLKKSAYKKNKHDFVLWKPSGKNEPGWESPWGRGRPGWHIECSAMIYHYFQGKIDIHGGGLDLLFPHNENERAQSMCALCIDELARFWLHNGFITFCGTKMSKSSGNVIYLKDLQKKISPVIIRWILLICHYRSPLAWQTSLLKQARANLDSYFQCIKIIEQEKLNFFTLERPKFKISDIPVGFYKALSDDLNTPQAIREFLKLIHEIHNQRDNKAEVDKKLRQLWYCAWILGISNISSKQWFEKERQYVDALKNTCELSQTEIQDLLNKRNALRNEKRYQEADQIRQTLDKAGIEIMDKDDVSSWQKK